MKAIRQSAMPVINEGRRLPRCAISWHGFLFCTLWFPAISWGQDSYSAKLIEGAKKETSLVWYTSTSTEDIKRLFDVFNKKYPFIKTEFYNAGSGALFNRIVNEARVGKVFFDLVSIRGVETYQLLKGGFLQPYLSPESAAYPPGFKDAKGYWVDYFDAYNVIGYNTKQIPKELAPRNWEDLLNPRWKSKIALDDEMYSWYAAMAVAWGRDRAQRFMTALAKQDIQMRSGQTLIAQLIAAGEFPIGIVLAHRIERMKEQGAPIEWVTTSDPSPPRCIRLALPPRRHTRTQRNCSSTSCCQRKVNKSCWPRAGRPPGRESTPRCKRRISSSFLFP